MLQQCAHLKRNQKRIEILQFYGQGLGYEVENQTLPFDKLNLTVKEEQALVAFMKTLTDKKYQ